MRHNEIKGKIEIVLLAVCVVVASASPGMAQCTGLTDSSQDLRAKTQMYSYMTAGIAQAQGGNLSAADQTWRAAYDYWTKHCYPDAPNWVNHVVRLIQGGKAQEAFQTFPGIVAPMYSDAGADTAYKNGLNAGQRGDFKIAANEFRNAIQIASKYSGKSCCPDADFMLGMALYGQGKRADATRQWRLTMSDSYPAVPQPEASGPDGFWLSALQLYLDVRQSQSLLGVSLATDKVAYPLGTDPRLTITVRNSSANPIRSAMAGAVNDVKLIILDPAGHEQPIDPSVPMHALPFSGRGSVLAPNSTTVEAQSMPLSSWGYKLTVPGRYEITAMYRASGSVSNTVTISVNP